MAVTAARRAAERSRVDNHLMRVAVPAGPHHGVAARREHPRRRSIGARRTDRLEGLEAAGAEQPRHLRCRAFRRPSKVRTPEHDGGDRKYTAAVVLSTAREGK